jgi:hypothetical protein
LILSASRIGTFNLPDSLDLLTDGFLISGLPSTSNRFYLSDFSYRLMKMKMVFFLSYLSFIQTHFLAFQLIFLLSLIFKLILRLLPLAFHLIFLISIFWLNAESWLCFYQHLRLEHFAHLKVLILQFIAFLDLNDHQFSMRFLLFSFHYMKMKMMICLSSFCLSSILNIF